MNTDEWINYRGRFGPIQHKRISTALDDGGRLDLPEDEKAAIKEAALHCGLNPYDSTETEKFIVTAQAEAKRSISPRTYAKVTEMLKRGLGAVLISNLPTDDTLPATPDRGGALETSYKATHVSEFASIVLGQLVGAEPFNFRQEGLGTSPLIDNIVPIKALQDQKGAGGYKNNFPFHSESAWHRLRPDYLILTGLRGDPRAQTLLFSIASLEQARDLLDTMPKGQQFRIAAPQLYQQMEASGMPMGTDSFAMMDPVTLDDDGQLVMNINFNGTDCKSEEAAHWLQRLEQFIEANAQYVVLNAATALMVSNDRTCHTRTGYEPTFDGKQRWFQRMYLQCNLWEAKNKPCLTSDVAQVLLSNGWINARSELTPTFLRFLSDHPDLKVLDPNIMSLVEAAYKFGPQPGSRVV